MSKFLEARLHKRRRVLVVDDEAVSRQMLEKILSEKYEVDLAENGRQALNVILENKDTLSLILLDLIMPEMDGYELLEIIQHDDNLRHIPVIVLTAEKSAEVKSLNMGAADFIHKPFDAPEVILARIARTIQLYVDRSIISHTQNDSLTDLFNREYFMEYVSVYDRYYPDEDMDAIVLDINRFHVLNEMHGRAFGDDVLHKMGFMIKAYVSQNRGIACRSNADCFFIYMPHMDDHDAIYHVIGDGVKELLEDAKARLRMGIYEKVDRSFDVHKRFDCALLACNSIRGKFSVNLAYYDLTMQKKEAYDERLISEMEKGLSEGQFKVYYQPKYDITGDVPVLASAEALVRWAHPDFGMIAPAQFISLFEEGGLIHKLDRYVWDKAAAQVKYWKKTYGVTLPVSVNVSRIDMLEPDFVVAISDTVRNHGLSPTDLRLEITESAYTEDAEDIIQTVNRLRSIGFKVEMDDFGTGYSSLNMLSYMPIDALKLDRGFIANIHKSEKDMRMVTLVMDIAEYLNLTVVAEGVELKEQYDLLKGAGCHRVQGFYFAKPMPAEEFTLLVRNIAEEKMNKDL